jgi:polar amino acid transport system permease protein
MADALLGAASALGFDAGLLARYGPILLQGLGTTLLLVAISVPLGFCLALPLALTRLQGGPLAGGAALAFTTFFRGTPLLGQLFLVYYGAGQFNGALRELGLWTLFRDAFFCAALTFTLNTAAYQAEIIRGALRSLPAGQTEAGLSLGMRRRAIYQRILLPQAMILALRPLGNELILMIKASSIASAITVLDLMAAAKRAFSASLDFEVYLWAAIVYLVLVEIVRRVWNVLERRMTRHLRTA